MGIDPGNSGGIFVLDAEGKWQEMHVMPVFEQKVGGKKRKRLDNSVLSQFFSAFEGAEWYCILEEQHPMPRQGTASMFNIGYSFGALKQCLVDHGIAHEVVRASEWQRAFGIHSVKGDTKAQAARVVQSLYPTADFRASARARKPHEGLVDACLIATYAMRRWNGRLTTAVEEGSVKGGKI